MLSRCNRGSTDDDGDPFQFCLGNTPAGKRVRFDRVRTPHDDQVGVQDVLEGVGRCTGTEREREPCDRRSVADTGAVVDVVCQEPGTCPLLQRVAVLVDGTARTLETKGLRPALFGNFREFLDDQVQGLVP